MQSMRDKNLCVCCSALLCKLSTDLNDDFQGKDILQPVVWPTEQSPQILQFDFDSYKQPPQPDFSFQIQHFCGDDHAEQYITSLKNAQRLDQTASKIKKNSQQFECKLQSPFRDPQDFYGLAGQGQSILDSQFINLQQMKEQLPKGILNQNEYLNSDNPTSEKNTNMPKFLLRLFFRHYRSNKACKAALLDQAALKFINEYQKRYLGNPKSFYKLDQLINVLRLKERIKQKNVGLRKIMNAILRAKGRLEILKSSQIKLKTSYMNAAKVYSLRCANLVLSQRLQSK